MTFMIYLSIDIERWFIFPSYDKIDWSIADHLQVLLFMVLFSKCSTTVSFCWTDESWFRCMLLWRNAFPRSQKDLESEKVRYLYSRAVALSRYPLMWFLVAVWSFYLIDRFRQSCGRSRIRVDPLLFEFWILFDIRIGKLGPVCYFKTRIKYVYCTVRNAHLNW